jgi:hypothetical protein
MNGSDGTVKGVGGIINVTNGNANMDAVPGGESPAGYNARI